MDSNVFMIIITFIVLLLSLSVHESAHAWTADRLGDPTARFLGRVSLNPIVHADLFGTIIFPLIGLFGGGFMFGWAKPVPVNVSKLRNPRRDHMIVAAAGPISNMLMALGLFICLMLMKSFSVEGGALVRYVVLIGLPDEGSSILAPLTVLAYQMIYINVLLAIFNLIPIAPLDGAAVLGGLLPPSLAAPFAQLQSYGFMILIMLIFLNIPSKMFSPVIHVVNSLLIGL